MQIVNRAKIELAALDNVVAGSDTVVELGVGCCGSVVVLNAVSRIDSPVDVELGEESLSHPTGGFAIGVVGDILGECGDDFNQFLFNPLGHFLTRRTGNNLAFSRHLLQNRSIAEAVHQDPSEIGTHSTRGSGHLGRSAASELLEDDVGFGNARSQIRVPVEGGIGCRAVVKSLMGIGAIVVVASIESKSRELVRSEALGFHVTTAECACQMEIDIGHLCLNHNHRVNAGVLAWVFSILGTRGDFQICTTGQCYGKQASCEK